MFKVTVIQNGLKRFEHQDCSFWLLFCLRGGGVEWCVCVYSENCHLLWGSMQSIDQQRSGVTAWWHRQMSRPLEGGWCQTDFSGFWLLVIFFFWYSVCRGLVWQQAFASFHQHYYFPSLTHCGLGSFEKAFPSCPLVFHLRNVSYLQTGYLGSAWWVCVLWPDCNSLTQG